ncbi:MAG: translation initiation factor eIF-1A [Candidatus Methanomethylicia archaeon]|nr:translation initiation factor eIF-1A [Candidatus Methanomethylicia archaeon]
MGKKGSIDESKLRPLGENEILGVIVSFLGFDRAKVKCIDGNIRICRIPGRFRKRLWFREGDIVAVVPWDFQPDSRGDIVWRYEKDEIKKLKNEGLLPSDLDIDSLKSRS